MKKKPYCVYLFTRGSKAKKGEAEKAPRPVRLRVEVKAQGKRFFVTTPLEFNPGQFQSLFESNGEWKPSTTESERNNTRNKALHLHCQMVWLAASSVVEMLIDADKLEHYTTHKFSDLVMEFYKEAVKAIIGEYEWRLFQKEAAINIAKAKRVLAKNVAEVKTDIGDTI